MPWWRVGGRPRRGFGIEERLNRTIVEERYLSFSGVQKGRPQGLKPGFIALRIAKAEALAYLEEDRGRRLKPLR